MEESADRAERCVQRPAGSILAGPQGLRGGWPGPGRGSGGGTAERGAQGGLVTHRQRAGVFPVRVHVRSWRGSPRCSAPTVRASWLPCLCLPGWSRCFSSVPALILTSHPLCPGRSGLHTQWAVQQLSSQLPSCAEKDPHADTGGSGGLRTCSRPRLTQSIHMRRFNPPASGDLVFTREQIRSLESALMHHRL